MNNIAFPKLGISLNISPVAFSIGSKPIYWYALIILSGFLLGLFFVYKTCEKRGVKKDNVWDIALFGLIFGIIGARIYYVLFALDEFDSIADMFKVWNGGLCIKGKNLSINQLNTDTGMLDVKGEIHSIQYVNKGKDGFFAGLFK